MNDILIKKYKRLTKDEGVYFSTKEPEFEIIDRLGWYENYDEKFGEISMICLLDMIIKYGKIYVLKYNKTYTNLKLGYEHFHWCIYYAKGRVEMTSYGKNVGFVKKRHE